MVKLKKLLLTLSSFLFPICAIANNNCSLFNGFYLGLSGGCLFSNTDENITVMSAYNMPDIIATTLHDTSLTFKDSLKNQGVKGAFYAGFGGVWQYFYLGTEIFASEAEQNSKMTYSSGADLEIVIPDFKTSIAVNGRTKLNSFEYGIDLRPGIVLPTTLFYGRVGMATNKIRIDAHAEADEEYLPPIFTHENFPITLQISHRAIRTALRLGAGIEHHINPCLSIRGDYIHSNYGTLSLRKSTDLKSFSVNRGHEFITLATNTNVKVPDNTVMLGLSYYFLDPCLLARLPPTFCAANLGTYNGFYLGASGGGSFTTGTETINADGNLIILTQGNFTDEFPYNAAHDLKMNSLKGALFAGYSLASNYVFLGVEGFASTSNSRMNFSGNYTFNSTFEGIPTNTSQITAESKGSLKDGEYGVDVRPGVLLAPGTLLYARVGTAFNTLSLQTQARVSEDLLASSFNPAETLAFSQASQASKKVRGCRIGGGIEQRLNRCLSIRADYIHTHYGKIRINDSDQAIVNSVNFGGPELITVSKDIALKVSNNTVMLGLAYYFGQH